MGAYRDTEGRWRYRKWITLGDGTRTRIKGTPSLNTKVAADQAEREHIARALAGKPKRAGAPKPRAVQRRTHSYYRSSSTRSGGRSFVRV